MASGTFKSDAYLNSRQSKSQLMFITYGYYKGIKTKFSSPYSISYLDSSIYSYFPQVKYVP